MRHSSSSHPITLAGISVVTAVLASMLPSAQPNASDRPLPIAPLMAVADPVTTHVAMPEPVLIEGSDVDAALRLNGPSLSEIHRCLPNSLDPLAVDASVGGPTAFELAALPVEDEPVLASRSRAEVLGIQDELMAGQTIAQALQQHGLSRAQVEEIVRATRETYNFRRAPAGMPFELRLKGEGFEVQSFRFSPEPAFTVLASRGEDGVLRVEREKHDERVVEVEVAARIKSSLYQAIRDAGESPKLASRVADVFSWDIDFSRDVKSGDSFRMIIEKRFLGEDFLGYGRVLAAEYAGRKKSFQAFWYVPEGETQGHYYQPNGESAEGSFLATPVEYTRISSRFRKNRKHPTLGFTKAHNGTDYAAPRGTPVRALAKGQIVFAGRRGPSGKLVIIKHDNGLESYYAHLSKISQGMTPGTRVNQKTMIGRVGTTGRSTGPHLHLGIKKHGKWIDPQKLKITRNEALDPEQLAAFKKLVDEQATRLAQIELPGEPQVLTASLSALRR